MLKYSMLFLAISASMATASEPPTLEELIRQQEFQLSLLPPELRPDRQQPVSSPRLSAEEKITTETFADELLSQELLEQATSSVLEFPRRSQPAMMASGVTAQDQSAENLVGSYYLFNSGVEVLNLTRGRLRLDADSGVIHFTNGSGTFDWVLDNEGFVVLNLHEPILTGVGFFHRDGQQRERHSFIDEIEFRTESNPDGSIRFIGEQLVRHHYPNGDYPDETQWWNIEFNGVSAAHKENLAAILPLNQAFNVPLDRSETIDVNYSFGNHSATVTNRSMRVELTERSGSSASGFWEYYTLFADGAESADGHAEHQVETVQVEFHPDGSATFIGHSGLTAEVSAFKRPSDDVLLLNSLHYQAGEDLQTYRAAFSSWLSVKNPGFERAAPGIYEFRQNFMDGHFWMELYEDGTAQTVNYGDFNNDGTFTFSIVPYLWQYTDSEDGVDVHMRRYRYKSNSGMFGWCTPEQFDPSPESDCQPFASRIIDFYDEATLNGETILTTEFIFHFYSNWFLTDNPANELVFNGISVDNRYFYLLDERPVALPTNPANDNFAEAAWLTGVSGQVAGTTIDATSEVGEPCHGGYCNGATVWYRFQAQEEGDLVIQLDPQGFDGVLAGYTGWTVDWLFDEGSTTYHADGSATWQGAVSAGTRLNFAVQGRDDSEGDFVLSWQFTPPVKTPLDLSFFPDERLRECVQNTFHIYFEDVRTINCQGVRDLEGIELLTNLDWLSLWGETWDQDNIRVLQDLSPLTELSRLQGLYLGTNQLTDEIFQTLEGFRFGSSGYVELNLYGNHLTDHSLPLIVDLLSEHPANVHLNLVNNNFTQLQPISSLAGLYGLHIGYNPLTDAVATVNQFSSLNLRNISLQQLGLSSLDGMELPKRLHSLSLSNNPLGSLTSVVSQLNVDTLNYLYLENTQIQDISFLESFTNLQGLDLSATYVHDIAVLTNLVNLRWVSLGGSYVSSIQPLLELERLDWVSLWGVNNLPCNEIDELQKVIDLERPALCRANRGYSYPLTQFRGYDVLGVSFDDSSYEELGKISWENGVLTFEPADGVIGYVNFALNIQLAHANWYVEIRIFVDPGASPLQRRRGLPKWIFVAASEKN